MTINLSEIYPLIDSSISRLSGVPYVHLGRNVTNGLDCAGLIFSFYGDFLGLPLPSVDWYPRNAWECKNNGYRRLLEQAFVWIDDPVPGGLVVFRKDQSPEVMHTGILTTNTDFMLHARRGKGVCVESRMTRFYLDKTMGFMRHRETI